MAKRQWAAAGGRGTASAGQVQLKRQRGQRDRDRRSALTRAVSAVLESLENRTLLSTVTVNGTGGDDTFHLVASGTPDYVDVYLNGSVAQSFDATQGQTQLIVNGLDGGDRLIVELPGNLLPDSGISFDGGAGSADAVEIRGTSGADELHATSGSAYFVVGSAQRYITFANAESAAIVSSAGADQLTISGGAYDLSGTTAWASGSAIALAGGSATLTTSITNNGTLTLAGGTLALSSSATLTNAGMLDLQTDDDLTGSAGTSLVNSGTLKKSGGTGISEIAANIAFSNPGGTIDVQTGTIQRSAAFTLASGQTLTKTGSGTLASTGAFGVAVGATLTHEAGDIATGWTWISGAYDLSGGRHLAGGNGLAFLDSGDTTHTATLQITGGTFTAPSGSVVILSIGHGTVEQSAGTLAIHNLYVGSGDAQGASRYELSGDGAVTLTGGVAIGGVGGGTLVQTGGSITAPQGIVFDGWGSTGTYTKSGGALVADTLRIGYQNQTAGAGTFSHSGGTTELTTFEVGTGGGIGTVEHSGGTIAVSGNFTVGSGGTYDLSEDASPAVATLLDVGGNFTMAGTFTQTGGDIVTGCTSISGVYNLSGGAHTPAGGGLAFIDSGSATVSAQLNLSGTGLFGGYDFGTCLSVGSATITQTGGTMSPWNLYIGSGEALRPTSYTLQDGTIDINGLCIGSASTSTLTQSGGWVSVAGDIAFTGWGSTGAYTKSGGTLIADTLHVGYQNQSAGAGTFNHSGGDATIGTFGVGGNGGVGTVNHSGGDIVVTATLLIAGPTGSGGEQGSGAYNLSGGELSGGTLTVNGGLAVSGQIEVGRNGRLVLPGTQAITGPGQVLLDGGTIQLDATSALTVSSGSTLRGVGAIVGGGQNAGQLINNGTIVAERTEQTPGLSFACSSLVNHGVLRAMGDAALEVGATLSIPSTASFANTGTVEARDNSRVDVQGSVLRGVGHGLSGTELAATWYGLSSGAGVTYNLEISKDGVNYTSLSHDVIQPGGTLIFDHLDRNTAYWLRGTSTSGTDKRVWLATALGTKDEADQSALRSILGFYFGQNIAPDAALSGYTGSLTSALLRAAGGLVTDGTVPVLDNGAYGLWRITPHEEQGSPYWTFDPSAEQTLSGVQEFYVAKVGSTDPGAGTQHQTTDPIRYFDGAVVYSDTDLQSDGFGGSFGITRSWTNRSQPGVVDTLGNGMVNVGLPTLSPLGSGSQNNPDTVQLTLSADDIRTFKWNGSSYVSTSPVPGMLSHHGTQLAYTDPTGQVIRFQDFDGSGGHRPGSFLGRRDAAGNTTTVTAWTASGDIEVVVRRGAGQTAGAAEAWIFTYVDEDGENDGRVSRIELRKGSGEDGLAGTWALVRQAQYAYYGSGDTNGSRGDLKIVTVKDAAGTTLDATYYRYYAPPQGFSQTGVSRANRQSFALLQTPPALSGYGHDLKFVIGGQALARLAAANPNYQTATDAQVAPYAQHYFEYDRQRRCTRHDIAGFGGAATSGIGTFQYAYAAPNPSTTPDAPGVWRYKTVETLPDGNQTVVYANSKGQVLLKVFCNLNDPVSPQLQGKMWGEFWKYDDAGRILWHANPSALDLPASLATLEAYDDLLNAVGGNYQYLRDHQGLIDITEYFVDDPQTTDDDMTVGEVAAQKIRCGDAGTDVLLTSADYFVHSYTHTFADQSVEVPIVVPLSVTVYRNDDPTTGGATTIYDYSWYNASNQIKELTTTLPAISTDHNGSGDQALVTEVFDPFGYLAWLRDADGYIHYSHTDLSTGAVTTTIEDVNTNTGSGFEDLPAQWSTRAGGGRHPTTTIEVDALGRPTAVTDARGNVTYIVYNDAAHEIRYYQGWDTTSNRPTGPTRVVREDRDNGLIEELTISAAPHLTNGRPDGTESITDLQSLYRMRLDASGQLLSVDRYFNLTGVSMTNPGAQGTNFRRTTYAYDANGNLNWVQDPTGTIINTRFDSLGRAASMWTGPTALSLVETAEYRYDNDAVGDGNLTRGTLYASATTGHSTYYQHDWRNRLIRSRDADAVATVLTYDNLDQVTQSQTYANSTVTAQGNIEVTSPNLRGQTETGYDDLGDVYQIVSHQVSGSGDLGHTYTTNYWYDGRGNLIKSASPSGLFGKFIYDGVGNPTASFTSFDADESGYAEALDVAGDTVIEQTRWWYDASGNVVTTAVFQRFEDDDITTGELTAANAYASSSVNWYDRADRLTHTAVVGHEGSTGTRRVFATNGTLIDANGNGIPDLAEASPLFPNTSDDYIAAKYDYDAAGQPFRTTDNKGHVTQTLRNAAGQVTATIENFADGVVGETETDTDRTTEYLYDAAGRLVRQRALNPKGTGNGVQNQDTRYLYGDAQNPYDVTSTIYPDSTDTDATGIDQVKVTYDWLGRATTRTDQRGVVHGYSYDTAGRLLADTVTSLGRTDQNVDGAVRRIEYGYDDLSRIASATSYDATSGGNVVNQIVYSYGGSANQLVKTQQSHAGPVGLGTPAVEYDYADGAVGTDARFLRLAKVTYPDGREVTYDYATSGVGEPLGRLQSISDASGILARYTFLGASTIVKVEHPEVTGGLNLSLGSSADDYSGLDRFGRVVGQEWRTDGGTLLDGYGYAYDRSSNRTARDNLLDNRFDELYGYDGLDRLADTQRSGTAYQSWDLDSLGNWSGFTDQGTSQTRTADAANQITGISAGVSPTYDAAGNMVSGPSADDPSVRLHYAYDAWNRLVAVRADNSGTPGSVVATYAYDAQGRRVQKTVGEDTLDYYYNEAWQVLQVDKNGEIAEQYTWDVRYVDAPICRDRDTDADGVLDERLYYVQDANFNVTALVDMAGAVVERYVYDGYGKVTVYAGDWTLRSGGTAFDNCILFAGYYRDAETGNYYVRNRYYQAGLGWMQRDPLQFVDSLNLYEYVSSEPVDFADPFGFGKIHGNSNSFVGETHLYGILDNSYSVINPSHIVKFGVGGALSATGASARAASQLTGDSQYYLVFGLQESGEARYLAERAAVNEYTTVVGRLPGTMQRPVPTTIPEAAAPNAFFGQWYEDFLARSLRDLENRGIFAGAGSESGIYEALAKELGAVRQARRLEAIKQSLGLIGSEGYMLSGEAAAAYADAARMPIIPSLEESARLSKLVEAAERSARISRVTSALGLLTFVEHYTLGTWANAKESKCGYVEQLGNDIKDDGSFFWRMLYELFINGRGGGGVPYDDSFWQSRIQA